jgi:hypothetical protein
VPWLSAKRQLTVRLDEDVLAWLKSLGKGYQTRINRILRVAMGSHRAGHGTGGRPIENLREGVAQYWRVPE